MASRARQDFDTTVRGLDDKGSGLAGRQLRGGAIASSVPIKKIRLGYKVPSQSGKGSYVVNLDGEPFCTCLDFERRQQPCKHIYAVQVFIQREEKKDGAAGKTKAIRVTYSQNWRAYNDAQTKEKEHFMHLLRELCDTVPQPPHKKGRPRLPLSDMLFSAGLKVYSGMSGRRAMTDIRNARAAGLLNKVPSFTSIFRYLENPELTPLLKTLIEQSALPLGSLETKFAVDSSGFSTSVYNRWFDYKWGKIRKEARWVKAHAPD